jgi:hypothetical protein
MPTILANQEAEIRRVTLQSQSRQIVHETLYEKNSLKIGMVEWLKAKALRSSPGTASKKKKREKLFPSQS